MQLILLAVYNIITNLGNIMNTQYTLNLNSHFSSMISHLLDDDHITSLNTLTPGKLEDVFGPGDDSAYIPSKGYTDPEWYWKSSDGNVWGIGWRWGRPRLRGGGMNTNTVTAYEFMEYLKRQMAAHCLLEWSASLKSLAVSETCPTCGVAREPGDAPHLGFRCGCWQK